MEEHITPRSTYFFVYLALMLLLALTVGAALVDLGAFNLAVTLAIAIVKALLVILFFMHVRRSDLLTKVFAAAGFIFVGYLLFMTMVDYLTRWFTGLFR